MVGQKKNTFETSIRSISAATLGISNCKIELTEKKRQKFPIAILFLSEKWSA